MTDPLTALGALVGATAISMVALSRTIGVFKNRLNPIAGLALLVVGFALFAVSMLPVPLLETWAVTILVLVVMTAEMAAFTLLTKQPPPQH